MSLKKNHLNSAALISMLALAGLTVGGPAAAHHPLGGALPDTFLNGLLSGIGHPVIGFDHLAFVVAAGVASTFFMSRYLLPIFFIAATVVGCLIHSVGNVAMPLSELAIAGSVLLLGLFVIMGREVGPSSLAGLFALAGLFHGSAYAEAILGAEATPLAAYLLGFSFIQYAVAVMTSLVVREAWKAADAAAVQPRLAGALLTGVGATFLIEHVESLTFPSM